MQPVTRWRVAFFSFVLLALAGAAAGFLLWQEQEREASRQRTARRAAEQEAAQLRQELAGLRSDSTTLLGQLEEAKKAGAKLDLIQRAKSWPITLVETFAQADSPAWPQGDAPEIGIDGKRSISFGEYVWSGTSHGNVIWYTEKSPAQLANFYLAVEARKLSGPADAYAALLLRKNGVRYYSFRVNDTSYSLWLQTEAAWTPLRPWTVSPAIHLQGKNRMSVIVQDSHLILMINDQIVDELDDASFSAGDVDFGIGLLRADESATFAFDSLEIRHAPG